MGYYRAIVTSFGAAAILAFGFAAAAMKMHAMTRHASIFSRARAATADAALHSADAMPYHIIKGKQAGISVSLSTAIDISRRIMHAMLAGLIFMMILGRIFSRYIPRAPAARRGHASM